MYSAKHERRKSTLNCCCLLSFTLIFFEQNFFIQFLIQPQLSGMHVQRTVVIRFCTEKETEIQYPTIKYAKQRTQPHTNLQIWSNKLDKKVLSKTNKKQLIIGIQNGIRSRTGLKSEDIIRSDVSQSILDLRRHQLIHKAAKKSTRKTFLIIRIVGITKNSHLNTCASVVSISLNSR
jgi:hypothetical protein